MTSLPLETAEALLRHQPNSQEFDPLVVDIGASE
jgi:hypothetical protein